VEQVSHTGNGAKSQTVNQTTTYNNAAKTPMFNVNASLDHCNLKSLLHHADPERWSTLHRWSLSTMWVHPSQPCHAPTPNHAMPTSVTQSFMMNVSQQHTNYLFTTLG